MNGQPAPLIHSPIRVEANLVEKATLHDNVACAAAVKLVEQHNVSHETANSITSNTQRALRNVAGHGGFCYVKGNYRKKSINKRWNLLDRVTVSDNRRLGTRHRFDMPMPKRGQWRSTVWPTLAQTLPLITRMGEPDLSVRKPSFSKRSTKNAYNSKRSTKNAYYGNKNKMEASHATNKSVK